MPSLYGGTYKLTDGFGTLGTNPAAGQAGATYDLGDASGLGNAAGVLSSGNTAQETALPRKPPIPKRKKKKLGGPGSLPAYSSQAGTVAEPDNAALYDARR
jgi:hypothetical protein